MGGGPGMSVAAQLWRFALVGLGAFLLQATVRDALARQTSWRVITIGALAGAALAAAAGYRPRRAQRANGKPEPTHELVLPLAVAALFVVVVQLQRYGAAVGAFCLVIGAVALDRATRQARSAHEHRSRRNDRPGAP